MFGAYAPATPTYTCQQPECPYFDCDPRLDPPGLPQPGWVADVEVDVAIYRTSATAFTSTVTLGGVTNRVELWQRHVSTGLAGRAAELRLPAPGRLRANSDTRLIGFLGSLGTGTVQGPALGPGTGPPRADEPAYDPGRGRFRPREQRDFSICHLVGEMAISTGGERTFTLTREPTKNEAVAAGGSGIFERRTTNN